MKPLLQVVDVVAPRGCLARWWGLVAVCGLLLAPASGGWGQEAEDVPAGDASAIRTQPSSLEDLFGAIGIARRVLRPVEDYSMVVVKRERIGDQLRSYQTVRTYIRHDPFSVRLEFTAPDNLAGQRALYVEGRHDNQVLARSAGLLGGLGPLRLDPHGAVAMAHNRFPITRLGLRNLLDKIESDNQPISGRQPPTVVLHRNTRIDGRASDCFQWSYNQQLDGSELAAARLYLDRATGVPIRYEQYGWPERQGGPYRLDEEYTFYELRFNLGLEDRDFDPENPALGFFFQFD